MTERTDSRSPRQSGATVAVEADGPADPTLERTHAEVPGDGRHPRDAYLRQILAAMVAFREGDFSVRLPTDWSDIEGRIAEAFNQTIAQEDRIAQEISRVSVLVGKEGRLKRRMAMPVATGGWAVKVES